MYIFPFHWIQIYKTFFIYPNNTLKNNKGAYTRIYQFWKVSLWFVIPHTNQLLLLFRVQLRMVSPIIVPQQLWLYLIPHNRDCSVIKWDFLSGTHNALGRIGLWFFPNLPPSFLSELNHPFEQLNWNVSSVRCTLPPSSDRGYSVIYSPSTWPMLQVPLLLFQRTSTNIRKFF